MVEPNTLKQVKEIIANLKEQNENKASLHAVNDNSIVSGILQEYHNDFQHKFDASLTVCKPKSKEKPVLIESSNLTQDESVVNINEEIKDIINTWKAKKEQNINKTIANSDVLQKNPDNVSFTNLYTKKAEESVLINGGEILRKYNPNYSQKQNNKRFKTSDNNDNKQLCLKQFYNVVKTANSCQNEREFNSKLEDHTEKNKNLDPVIRNSEENKKSLDYTHAERVNTLFSFQSNQKLKEIKVWDIFSNIKRNEVPQHFNTHVRKSELLKETTPKQTGKSGITLDDFFKNIISNRNKTLENGCTNLKALENIGNNFLKSFSTGNIISEKEKHKDTDSVPVTNYEIKHIKGKLEDSTKTLDEVIEKILKNINNGNSENIESKIKVNDNFEDKLEKYINEEDDRSKKPTATHNSQLTITDSLTENTEYINLSCDIKIPEYNQDNDSRKYSIRDGKKNEVVNKKNEPDLILKEEPRKEYNLIEVISMMKQQKESRGRNKENIFFKSVSNRNIFTENADYNNTNSLQITSDEKQNVNKRVEDNTSNFDDVMKKIMKKIKSDENSDKSKIHSCGHENPEKNTFLGNEREKSSNENMVISKSIQYIDCNKNFQASQHEENSFKSYFDGTEPLIETNNCNLTSNINFTEHGQDIVSEKNLVKDYFDNFSQDIEMYYSQFTQKYTDSACNEDINSEQEHSTKGIEADFTNEKEDGIEEVYKCKDSNCSENNTDIASVREEIDLLENKLEKSILMATYKKETENTKEKERNMEANKPFKLEDFLKNLIPSIEKKECKRNIPCKNKILVKKYRKGKIKIYKLKKLRKKCLKIETEDVDEDVTFQDLLKKISCGNSETKPRMSKFKSGSSISTSSSYITDDTKSEVLSTGSKELTSPQQRLRYGFNELSKDKTLRYSEKEWDEFPEHTKEDIKMKIQDVFFQILEDFKNKRSSFFTHRKQSFDNCIFKNGRLQIKPMEESSMTIINSQAQRSKAKFQLMLYIMKKIQTLLETDTKLTKRELYYQLKELISDQRVTDRAINAISCLLDVGMWALNIIAQKGLVFGNLKLLLSSGEMLNCNIPGTLIPQDVNDIVEVHSAAYFILVVEKESIFHKLIQEDLPNKLTRPFIMITGKGFPDLNTQLFLRKLWMVMSIPVFILVDADPHGINIMLNYRFGSVNNAHVSQHLAVPNAKWLGVYPSEVINLNIARQPLSEREIKLVNRILQTPYMDFSLKLVEELKVLSTKKFKASIEGLIKTDRYLSEVYLPNKFFAHNFI